MANVKQALLLLLLNSGFPLAIHPRKPIFTQSLSYCGVMHTDLSRG
uniref:Uncharacterized protein n=1 Tax=Anguilla anguilla TaxID=7936 RepID=A0A0E9U732_ANGAN